MKGFRTIFFNAVMVAVGVTGAQVSPDMATDLTEAFVAVWGLGNVFFRAVTNSPMFKKGEAS